MQCPLRQAEGLGFRSRPAAACSSPASSACQVAHCAILLKATSAAHQDCNSATVAQHEDACAITGGGNKFVVRRHNDSGMYVTLSNPQTTAAAGRDQRSVLALTVSEDLRTWRRRGPAGI